MLEKLFRYCLSLLCTLSFNLFLSPEQSFPIQKVTVVAALYEPFIFYEEGKLKGFDVDLLNLVCTSRGLDCSVQIVSFKEVLQMVADGRADMAIGAIYVTEERKKLFNYTVPYQKTGLVPVFRTDNVFSLKGLDGKRIGVKESATGQKIANQMIKDFKDTKVVPFLTTEESFEALIRGEVDIVLNDYINTVCMSVKHYPGKLVIGKGLFGPIFLQKTYIAYPVNKNRPELLQIFNEEIKKLSSISTLERLSLRWLYLSEPKTYEWIIKYILIGLIIVGIVTAGVVRHMRTKALKELLKNLKSLFETTPMAIYISQKGVIVYVNPSGLRLLGYTTSEKLLGQKTEKLFCKEGDRYREVMEAIDNDSTEPKVLECKFVRADGKLIDVYVSMNSFIYNKLPAVQIVVTDISKKKEAEETVSRLLQIQYVFNRLLRIGLESKDLKELTDRALDEILSVDFISFEKKGAIFLHDKSVQKLRLVSNRNLPESVIRQCESLPVRKCLWRKVAEEKQILIKSSLDKKEGCKEVTGHEHCCIPIIEENELIGVISLYLSEREKCSEMELEFLKGAADILSETIRRHMLQDELTEKEKIFFSAVDNSPVPILIYNEEGEIIHINKRLLEITGFRKEELQKIDDFIKRAFPDPKEQKNRIKEIEELCTTAEPVKKEDVRIRTVENKERIWNIIVMSIGTWAGKRTIMCVAEDLTEERSLQEQLIQSQKLEAIGRLSGGIAHDFNNILSAIIGYAQLGLLKLSGTDPLRKNFEIILKSAEKASKLVQQLLAFSRRQVMKPEAVNLNSLLENMQTMLTRLIGEDIQVEINKKERLWNVKVDPVQIEQVIMNLVINARDAMPKGGKLIIETDNVTLTPSYAQTHRDVVPGDYVLLSISDTGCGMTEEVKAHIFEPFFTTKEPGKGTGLGLATVYGIVKQSNGHIFVYSEPERGTTFKIYFPRYKEEKEKRAKGEEEIISEDLPKGDETILVVEDDEDVRNFTVTLLNELGYTVIEAETPSDALHICDRYHGRIHLLLTDVVLPEMDGRQLAEQMKETCPELKVIYMSGYTDNVIIKHGIIADRVAFLQKPFSSETLARTVRMVLDSN
jgi:PAS domain S-box-containing protein